MKTIILLGSYLRNCLLKSFKVTEGSNSLIYHASHNFLLNVFFLHPFFNIWISFCLTFTWSTWYECLRMFDLLTCMFSNTISQHSTCFTHIVLIAFCAFNMIHKVMFMFLDFFVLNLKTSMIVFFLCRKCLVHIFFGKLFLRYF